MTPFDCFRTPEAHPALPHQNPANRSAWRLTALIMAHGLAIHAQAGTAPSAPTSEATNATPAMEKTVITGQAGGEITSQKFTEPLLDTPHSISVVPRQTLEDQGATTLRDALRNVAGISLAAGEGGAQGDNLTLRGFTARNDIFLDGMRDFGSYYRDPFHIEQVEVLKGPESVLFGRGSTGGVVNQATKTPERTPFVNGSLSFGTDLTRRATLDVNEPVPALGQGTAVRLNLMGHASEVAGRDVTENQRFGVAPSLTLGLGTSTRATFSYFHQSEDDIPDYGVPWLFNGPAPVERHYFYGFRDDYLRTSVDMGTVRLEHDLNENISLRDQLRYANYSRDFRITEPQATTTIGGKPPSPSTPLETILVRRNEIAGHSTETFFQNQLDSTVRFDTSFIQHTMVGGLEVGRETSDPTRYAWSAVPTTRLLSPNIDQAFSGTSTVSSKVQTTATSLGLYALDTLKLTDQWHLSGGFRWDYFDAEYANAVTGQSFDRVDTMPSWRGTVVYKPRPNGSLYFAYGTSFNPSAETLALTAGNANLPPEENQTFELGTKWDLSSNRLSVRGALFRTEKTNARETNPANSAEVVLAGEQRVDGVELELTGRLTQDWRVMASYAYMKSEEVSSRFFPAAVGSPLANVPRQMLNFWTTYTLPWHLEIGGGVNYVASRTASSTVPFDPVTGLLKEVPAYWKMDALIKYRLNTHVELQLNLYNLTDNAYYDQIHPGHIVPGAGRSALLTANFKF
jgi:catecholate siderophore receptor